MRRIALAVFFTGAALGAACADDPLQVTGAYARISSPTAATGAVFMTIENPGAVADRLLSGSASVAERTELHTHTMSAEGMMQMLEVPEGFAIPAGGSHSLDRGGDHVMLFGLTRPLVKGDSFTLDMTFEQAGKIVVIVTVGDAAPTHHSGHGMMGN